MAKRFKATLTHLPCPCGGTYEPFQMKDYDATAALGLPVLLTGEVLGVRCDRCGAVAVSGAFLDAVTPVVVRALLERDRRLSGAEARFLRKALSLSLDDIETQMGVPVTEVREWESARSLTAREDFQLRAFIVGLLLRGEGSRQRSGVPRLRVIELATKVLQQARHGEAPSVLSPLPVDSASLR